MPSRSLYRAWRPQRFADMVGQEHVARTLLNSLRERRTAHAYLFTGPRGTGKTSAARILAKALNCAEPVEGEPCNACAACIATTEGRSMDVMEIDGASNRGIDQIRDLREKVNLAPGEGKYRFYIIDEVHQLTGDAFNALLKTLEEPPAHVVFVLATTDPQKVPPTVSSRCQRFAFHRIAEPLLLDRLRQVAKAEGIDVSEGALLLLARTADGGLRDGLSLLDQAIAYCGTSLEDDDVASMLGLVSAEAVSSFVTTLESRDAEAGLALLQRLVDEGNDPRQFGRQVVEELHQRLVALGKRGRGQASSALSATDLVQVIRLFSDTQFGNRLLHAPQLPLELAVVTWSSVPKTASPAASAEAATGVPARSRAHASDGVSAPLREIPESNASSMDSPIETGQVAVPTGGKENVLTFPSAVVPPPRSADQVNGALVAATVPDDVRRLWLRSVQALKAKSPRINAYCNSCQLVELREDTLYLTTQVGLVREQLGLVAIRRSIEDAVASVFGRTLTVRCQLASERADCTPPSVLGAVSTREESAPSEATSTISPTPASSSSSAIPSASQADVAAADPIEAAERDPVVREVLRVFGGGRVDGVIPH